MRVKMWFWFEDNGSSNSKCVAYISTEIFIYMIRFTAVAYSLSYSLTIHSIKIINATVLYGILNTELVLFSISLHKNG